MQIGDPIVKRVLVISAVLLNYLLVAPLAVAHSKTKRQPAQATVALKKQRGPASGQKACLDSGCSCEDLKLLVRKCDSGPTDFKNSLHSDLAIALRSHQEEARRVELKACPVIAAAEACREKIGKMISGKKTKNSQYKVSASQDLGKFSVDMLDAISRNPRSPANQR